MVLFQCTKSVEVEAALVVVDEEELEDLVVLDSDLEVLVLEDLLEAVLEDLFELLEAVLEDLFELLEVVLEALVEVLELVLEALVEVLEVELVDLVEVLEVVLEVLVEVLEVEPVDLVEVLEVVLEVLVDVLEVLVDEVEVAPLRAGVVYSEGNEPSLLPLILPPLELMVAFLSVE